MVQDAQSNDVSYACRRIGASAGDRIPRAEQSAAAEALLQELRARMEQASGPASKAHSRAMVAAAIAPRGRVGIDIEYCDPRRDIGAVASWLAGRRVAEEAAAYRLFTFREAYFKAFGGFPERTLMFDIAQAGSHATADWSVRFETVEDRFALALVWTEGGAPARAGT